MDKVLILVVMDDALARKVLDPKDVKTKVLILVVMDDALALVSYTVQVSSGQGLNPCCNG